MTDPTTHPTRPPTRPRPTTLKARNPEDLLAAVPCVLGFRPTESVVMLTFPRRRARADGTFHARLDLPGDPADHPAAVAALLDPVLRHRIDRVVLVLYTEDAARAAPLGEALVDGFTEAGVEVLELLRADGERWFALLPDRPRRAREGLPYDDRSHPFLAQAVMDGRVTLGSREELADSLLPGDADAVCAVGRGYVLSRSVGPADLAHEAGWLREVVLRRCEGGALSDAEAGRLVAALDDVLLRDVAWAQMSRVTAEAHVELWRDVVRRCPDDLLAAPTTLLAFAAWLAGHGALAWCALERGAGASDGYRLAGLVAHLLEHAVAPSSWEPFPDPVP